jgi:hypothetical protein
MQKQTTAPKGLNRDEIWQLHLEGFGDTQIARKLGCVRSTVIHHLKGLRKEKGAKPDSSLLNSTIATGTKQLAEQVNFTSIPA